MPLKKTIGYVTLKAEILDEVSGVDESMVIDEKETSFNGEYKIKGIGRKEIKVIAYDKAGNKAIKTIDAWIFAPYFRRCLAISKFIKT